ncbi:MAG: hypothetical protein KDB07_08080, partial [Planctomycetes bacterium]|nr:hypothetical protein [Planctomycetota bacterium]
MTVLALACAGYAQPKVYRPDGKTEIIKTRRVPVRPKDFEPGKYNWDLIKDARLYYTRDGGTT